MIFIRFSIFLIIILFCNAGGYVGTLPELGKITKPVEQIKPVVNQTPATQNAKEIKKVDMPPLAPRKFQDLYAKTIIKGGKYSHYLKDLNDIIPCLESIKEYIKSDDQNIQLLCAKVHIFNLYIYNLKAKYGSKPEHNYESYKQMLIVDKYLTDAANYSYQAAQYKKIYQVSSKRSNLDKMIIQARLNKALKTIDKALDILNDNTRQGEY